jgi:hypothetical protein
MSKFVLTAQLQLQAPNNVGQVVKQIQNQLNSVNVSVKAKGAAQATKQVQNLSKALSQADKASYKLGKTFTSSLKRFAAFSVATRAVSLLTQGLGGAIAEAVAFERELMKVAQVTGRTLGQLKGLTDEITKLATSLGVSSKELLSVSRALSQAGFSAYETKVALDALAKSSLAPTFEDMAKTAEGAIAIFNQFGKGAAALEGQLGAINAVAGRFAVEAGDLISVIRRTGGVFKAAGGDLNELIALFTSVRSTTRESAESIATGLRTIFTRIQRPRTIQFLKEMGVSLTDVEGKFVGPYEAVKRLSAALSGLEAGDLRFVKIAEQLGGFRQIGKVIPLLQQFATAQEAYNVALGGSASLAADAEKAQGSLAVKVQKLKEEWLALIRGFTDSTGFKIMTSAALNLATAIIKMLDALKDVLPVMLAMASVKMFKGMGGFMAGAKSGAMGSVPKFASGGMVPGSGNRDTVPAMLTPGEFVIRKSSVKKMGAGNLNNMNAKGYAKGGTVKIHDDRVGMFALIPNKGDNVDRKGSYSRTITNPVAIDRLRKMQDPNYKSPAATQPSDANAAFKQFDKKSVKEQTALMKGAPEDLQRPKPGSTKSNKWFSKSSKMTASKGEVGAWLLKNQKSALSSRADLAAGGEQITLKAKMKGMLLGSKRAEGANAEGGPPGGTSITGDIAKATSASAVSGLKKAVKDVTKAVKKTGVLKKITKAIDPDDEKFFSSMKNLVDPKVPGGAVQSIEGFVQEGLISAITGAKVGGGSSAFDFPRLSKVRGPLAKLYGTEGMDKISTADAKRNMEGNWPSIVDKIINEINGGAAGENKRTNLRLVESVKGMASGGSVGTDTVPALLTPGEFVVNAKSAQSIGHANLNSMNKKGVSKFAAGGIVGPKKFAGGGGVGKGEMGMMGMLMVMPMIQSSFEAMAGKSDLMSDSFEAVNAGVTSFMGAMIPMNMIMAGWDKDLEKGGNDLKEMGAQAGDAIEAGLSALNITTITITAKIVNLTGTINMAGGGGGGGGLGSAAAGMAIVNTGSATTRTAAATATIQKEGVKGGGGGGDVKSAKMTIATAKLKVESATAKKVKIESAGEVKIKSAAAVTFKTVSTISIKGKVTINAASVAVKGGGKVDAPAAGRAGTTGAKFEKVDTLPSTGGGGGGIGKTVEGRVVNPKIAAKPQATPEMEAAAKHGIDPTQVKSAKPKQALRLGEGTGLSELNELKGIKTNAEAKLATEQGALDKHTTGSAKARTEAGGRITAGLKERRSGEASLSEATIEAKKIQEERDELAKGKGNKSKSGRDKRVKATQALNERSSANEAKIKAAEQSITAGQGKVDEGNRTQGAIDSRTAKLKGTRDKTAKGLTSINENIAGREAARTQTKPMLAGTGSPQMSPKPAGRDIGPKAMGRFEFARTPEAAAMRARGDMPGVVGVNPKPKPVMSRYDAARTPEAAAMRARGEHPSIIGTPDKRSPARQALESRELVRETAPRPAGPGLPTPVPTGTVIGGQPQQPPGAVPPGVPPSQKPVKPVEWKKLTIEQKKAVIATKLMSRSMNKSGIKKSLQHMRIGIRKMSPTLYKFGKGIGNAIKRLKKMGVKGAMTGLGKMVGKLGPVFKGVADAAKKFVDAQFNRALANGEINLSDFDKSDDAGGTEGAGVTGAEALFRTKLNTDAIAQKASGAMAGMMAGGMAAGPIGALVGAGVGMFQEELMGGVAKMASDGFSLENFQKGFAESSVKKEEALMSQIADENFARFSADFPDLIKAIEKGRGDEFSVGELSKEFKNAQLAIEAKEKTDPSSAKRMQKEQDKRATTAAAAIGGQVRSQAELEARINTLTTAYGNNIEEVRNAAKAAFAAAEALRAVATIKADILAVSSIFGAASLAVGNFTSSLVTGSNSMTATVNTLKEAQKNIALGRGGRDAVAKARGEVMSRSGIDPASEAGQAINRQFDVLNQAAEVTSQLPKVLKDTKISLGDNPTEVRTQLTEGLTDSMGIDQDSQMGKIIAGEIGKLTDNQIADIQSGKLDLSTVLGNIGPEIAKLGEGALKAAEALQKHEATIIKMTQQRMKMEADLLKAQQKAIDLHMEAAKIAAKHGGRNLTANQKRQAIMDKANLSARSAGVRGLGGTTGGDIRTMSARMTQQSGMQSFRAQLPGSFEGPQGLDADKRQKLAKAQQDLIKTTKDLIKVEQEELKISKEKNRLERQSLEALLGGDVEGFMKGQGARGATSAVASGSATLMSMFGADEMAGAFKNVQQMQKAGVGSFGGMDINTLMGAAGSQALGMRGIHDASSAAVLTGQTAEENAANARIRDLAGGLSAIGENAAQMAEMEVNTANININNANLKFKTEIGRAASQFARGGPVYANAGMFIPRGTDTVPAMLTPGEFVINRASVNRGNNLQILKAINSGASAGAAQAMSGGGSVGYYHNGGGVGGGLNSDLIDKLSTGLRNFNTQLKENIDRLQKTKFQIKLDTTNVNVTLNSGGFLRKLKAEVKDELLAEVGEQIKNIKISDSGGVGTTNTVI